MKLLGDLLMCAMIIGGIAVFTWANVNYTPESSKEEADDESR